jgi:hypothetical protein
MHLVRIGRKLLLIAVSPAGSETLTEITDPVEVDRLGGLCQQHRAGSATHSFRQVLEDFSHERPAGGEHSIQRPMHSFGQGRTGEDRIHE